MAITLDTGSALCYYGAMDKNTNRFLAKVNDTGDCWEWQASISPDGYGYFFLNGKLRQAHRASYELFVGPIPPGLHIDHLCTNRKCVNPQHLEPVTQKENNARTVARITHCPAGHDYSITARYWGKKVVARYCIQCNRDKANARKLRMIEEKSKHD